MRASLVIPRQSITLSTLWRHGLFKNEALYDADGVKRGDIIGGKIKMDFLPAFSSSLSEAATHNEQFNYHRHGSVGSSWKYWQVERNNKLVTLYSLKNELCVHIETELHNMVLQLVDNNGVAI